jgi:hypothetical protein
MATPDDPLATLKRQQPPWDELLERRVLNDVHAAHRHKTERRRLVRRTGVLVASLVVAAGIGAWTLGSSDRVASSDTTVVVAGPAVTEPTEPAVVERAAPAMAQSGVMSLADGSRLLLADGAQVETQVQTGELIHLAHREGRVRYEVSHAPGRIFVVHAGAYQVRVVGTVFVIEVAGDRLRIEVERGAVEVTHAERSFELGAGEQIDLPRRVMPVASPAEVAVEEAPAKGTARPRRSTVGGLLEQADAARRSGRLQDAADVLEQLVREHARDPRASSAWFMLGRVERQLGHHAEAARAFRSAWKAGPSPALAEDARAEEAVSWNDAGSRQQATEAARSYLERYPTGTHVARVRFIVR